MHFEFGHVSVNCNSTRPNVAHLNFLNSTNLNSTSEQDHFLNFSLLRIIQAWYLAIADTLLVLSNMSTNFKLDGNFEESRERGIERVIKFELEHLLYEFERTIYYCNIAHFPSCTCRRKSLGQLGKILNFNMI